MISIPLSDSGWSLVEHLFTETTAARGRPRRNNRDVLNAILWIYQTGEKWHRLPGDFPSQQTCYQRYVQWKAQGVIFRVIEILEWNDQEPPPILGF